MQVCDLPIQGWSVVVPDTDSLNWDKARIFGMSRWRILSGQLGPKISSRMRFEPTLESNIQMIGRILDELNPVGTDTLLFLFWHSDTSSVAENARKSFYGSSGFFLTSFLEGI